MLHSNWRHSVHFSEHEIPFDRQPVRRSVDFLRAGETLQFSLSSVRCICFLE